MSRSKTAKTASNTLLTALSDSELLEQSGDGVFARGQAYAHSGVVQVTHEKAGDVPSIHAQVSGTQTYATSLVLEDGELYGSCNCPHANEGWFCKHLVALALVWRQRITGETPVIDETASKKIEASAKRAKSIADRQQALHDFLHRQSAATLADRMYEWSERDPSIARELQQWQRISEAPRETSDLKALITEILAPHRDFLRWNESADYVSRAEAVLPLLEQVRAQDPENAPALCLHAMRRGWAALERADDSDGAIGGFVEDIAAHWIAALQAAGPQPATFGLTYLKLLLEDPFGCFDAEAAEVAMGNAALTRFREVLARRWRQARDAVLAEKLKRAAHSTKKARGRAAVSFDLGDADVGDDLYQLRQLHLVQLEASGDIDGALSVLRDDLSEPFHYQEVTAFLERHERWRDAFANAEAGLKAFPNDFRLQVDMLRIYERDGLLQEALELRDRRFRAHPNVEQYHALLRAAKAAGQEPKELRKKLYQWLIEREDAVIKQTPTMPRVFGAPQRSARERDVSFRAELLCSEKRWDEALAVVQPPNTCDPSVLIDLAEHLNDQYRHQRVELLLRVFDVAMGTAASPYQHELRLVAKISKLMDAEQRNDWLTQLRTLYKAKKNFIRGLPPG